MAKKLYGTDPDQVPTNADLGTIAYQDAERPLLGQTTLKSAGTSLIVERTSDAPNLQLKGNGQNLGQIYAFQNGAGGNIAFYPANSVGTITQRMIINRDGNVTINNGNLVMGTSGTGIDFSSTGNGSGTMSSELLDDYEEGTWTPADGTAAGLTITINHASYTKIGRVVHVKAYILIPITTSGTNIRISGLPYTNVDASGWAPTLLTTNGSPGSTRFIRARANEAVLDVGTAEGDVSSTWSQYSNKWMIFSLVYSTS